MQKAEQLSMNQRKWLDEFSTRIFSTEFTLQKPLKKNKQHPGSSNQDITTGYDAVRIIQNDDGLFIKANDATLSRSTCESACGESFVPYTMVADCTNQLTTSNADLSRTSIKFSATMLPCYTHGNDGSCSLSSNNQVLTVTNQGRLMHIIL